LISEYFREVELRLKDTEIITDKSIDIREFSATEGMLRGRLLFVDGAILEFMEYLQEENRLKYRFHLMDKQGNIVFRYDNAPHRLEHPSSGTPRVTGFSRASSQGGRTQSPCRLPPTPLRGRTLEYTGLLRGTPIPKSLRAFVVNARNRGVDLRFSRHEGYRATD
jgi:hypothetical protein